MGQITIDQSHQVLATLAVNTDWESIDFEDSGLQDLIVRNPKEAGKQFTAFLRNGGKAFISEPTRPYHEQDGVLYFSVTSDGTTGPEWITRLKKQNFQVSDYTQSVLCSKHFQPTNRITTKIAVLKGLLWNDNDRITRNIRAEANKRNLTKPNAEVACLIREKFSDQDLEAMGLTWIIVMHDPINAGGGPGLLGAGRSGGGRGLGAFWDGLGNGWGRDGGFAFVVSQACPPKL